MNREYVRKLFDKFIGDIAVRVNVGTLTYNVFHDEIVRYKTNKTGKNYCMNIVECDDVFMLYTDKISSNLHYCEDVIDTIVHNFDLIVGSKLDMTLICYLKKADIYTQDRYKTIDVCFDTYKIYRNYIGVYHIVFLYKGIQYCCTKKSVFVLSDNKIIHDMLLPYIKDNMTSIRHFIIINAKLKKLVCHDISNFQSETVEKKAILIKEEMNDDTILICDKNVYFSCLDELLFDIEETSSENESIKKLTLGGYILMNENEKIIIENTTYRRINDSLPDYTNVHMCYLDLYKSDKLNEILPYMSNYYMDIVKRINISMKTISREILNIYHLTRNKDNVGLYTCLPNSYKKTMYDLHKLFIGERDREIRLDDYNRKSITIDDVYHYLKRVSNVHLFNVYFERNELIKKIILYETHKDVIYIDCIDTKTQTELMFT